MCRDCENYKTKADKQKPNYSKLVISAMTAIWLFVALFGVTICAVQFARGEYMSLDSLYSFVGLPMGGGIVGYLIKSAVENKEKIRTNPTNEEINKP